LGAGSTDAAARLNEPQRRSLSAGVHHVAHLLDEVERVVSVGEGATPFERFGGSLRPAEVRVVRDYLAQARRALLAAAERHGLDRIFWTVNARRAIAAQVTAAWIDVEEMRSRRLRGYGSVDPDAAREVDRTCDELVRVLGHLQRFAAGGPEEDYTARLSRLGSTLADPELLSELERVIREQGFVELRPLLGALLDRVEERTFHVAVFGRVSSGKSSLLNVLLGRNLLPVGVTPVTAVPTRVRSGSPAKLRVRFARGESEELPVEALASFATEEENPGNVKGVSRLELIAPTSGLPEGVELVDTPGIGSLASSGTAEALAYLPRTDLAVLLVDAGSTIGPEELGLLRLFKEAAIPAELVISKADLVDAGGLRKLVDYVSNVVAREAGWTPPVGIVSSVGEGRELVAAWARDRLVARFDRRRELAAESVRRVAGRLLEQVIASLERRAGFDAASAPAGLSAAAASELARAADTRIAEARRAAESAALESTRLRRRIVRAAAEFQVAVWNEGAPGRLDAAPALRRALLSAAEATRNQIVSELTALLAALERVALEIAPAAADLLSSRLPAPDLAGLPMLDASAVISGELPMRRIWLLGRLDAWTRWQASDSFETRLGKTLHDALHTYGYRLRDFALRASDRVAAAFHSAVAPYLQEDAVALDGSDREAISRDLAVLRSLRDRQDSSSTPTAPASGP
jgi:GTP-binding protein EngB required for normal cell division